MQNELATSTSNEDKTQLEGELVTIEEEIISTVSHIKRYEGNIQRLEEELDLKKEKHRKKGEELIFIQISCGHRFNHAS